MIRAKPIRGPVKESTLSLIGVKCLALGKQRNISAPGNWTSCPLVTNHLSMAFGVFCCVMTMYCGSVLHKDKDSVMCLLKQLISAVKGSFSSGRIVTFFFLSV